MSAHALHFPERPHVGRWTFAGLAILLAHAAFATALLLWYQRTPPEHPLLPAIMVSFAPAAPAAPPADEPIVQERREEQPQVEEPKVEEPKVDEPKVEEPKIEEAKIEEPKIEKVAPPPPRPAVIALPKPEPKRVERKEPKREERKKSAEKKWQPPQEEQEAKVRMPVATRQSNVASSNNYDSLVVGQLERNKRYPPGAPSGRTLVAFTVSSNGSLLSVHVAKSSGSPILDQATLDTVRRASPFPHFPPELTQAQKSFTWPLSYQAAR